MHNETKNTQQAGAPADPTDEMLDMLGRIHPFAMEKDDRSKAYERLERAYCIQQPWPVPDQACIVWRADLMEMRYDLIHKQACFDSKRAAPAPAAQEKTDVKDAAPDDVQIVLEEVRRATHKFPTWPTDPLHAVAVLGEEFGELTKAVLQTTYEPHKVKDGELRTEAIQTAAMALRFVASLERYEFARCSQHEQAAMSQSKTQGAT